MKICLICQNLTNLILAADLIQKKLKVDIYIDNNSYCEVGDAGIWYHFTDDIKQMGCDFLSNTIRSIKNKTINMTKDFVQFKESINKVMEATQ